MFLFRYQLSIISLIPLFKSLHFSFISSRDLSTNYRPFRLAQLKSSSTLPPLDDTDIKLKLKVMSSDEKDEYIINQASNIRALEQKLKDATVRRKVVKTRVKSTTQLNNQPKLIQSSDISIRVPDCRSFVKLLENCAYTPTSASYTCQHPVGLKESVDATVEMIMRELPDRDPESGTNPKMPIIFSRSERGGKTSTLIAVFNRLQGAQLGADRVRVMLISFKSSSGFVHREGETQKQAILRVIAQQLVEGTEDELVRLFVDEYALDDYIGAKPFVLLVDQINVISPHEPLNDEAARTLRTRFLCENRHLMMSTFLPMGVELRDGMCGGISRYPYLSALV